MPGKARVRWEIVEQARLNLAAYLNPHDSAMPRFDRTLIGL